MRIAACLICAALLLCAAGSAAAQGEGQLDALVIESLTGMSGQLNRQGDVFKVSAPRDVAVAVSGWPLPTFMGLTSWAAFTPGKEGVMVMGDIVLFEDEVNPAMDAALSNRLQVTALHNHFFYDQPRVYFMHVSGEGSTEAMAGAVGEVMAAAARVRQANPAPALSFGGPPLPEGNSISPKPLEAVFGQSGETKDGLFKVTFGREARMPGGTVGKDMGVNTWAAFGGADHNAIVDGDFAVTEEELQPVLKALRRGGVNIVAVHNHMNFEEPRILFLHYWGRGKALDLAQAVKAALDAQSGR